jgi:hypothetical protein
MTDPNSGEHPEDRLDLASAGRISQADWLELREHLASCVPCATQLRMSTRVLADRRVKSSDVHLDRVAIHRALDRARVSRTSVRSSSWPRWVPVGLGLLLISSGALAGTWWSVRHRERAPAVTPSPAATTVPAGTRTKHRGGLVESAQAPDAADAPGTAPTPAIFESPAKARPERVSASDLFARARALRLGGDAAGALSSYHRLQRQFADSRESVLSYLVVGRMWLERDRPDLAERQFTHYLDTGGSASEEALVGRATAFARIGRTADELGDWKRLLTAHPASVYAGRARIRLGELGETRDVPGVGVGPR